jgi:hypothetical protein
MPVARTLVKHRVNGPVFALGDQVSWIPRRYAIRKLSAAGLLRNPNLPTMVSGQNSKMASFQEILALVGFDKYYDIDLNGRAAITCDLSLPLTADLTSKAGVVIDIGTCEHIFNLPQAFTNIVSLLQPGGVVLHLAPLSWYDHGFVNFNPIFFREFYEHNGFEVLEHGLIVTPIEYSLQGILGRLGLRQRYLESEIPPISFMLDDKNKMLTRVASHIGLWGRIIFLFAGRKGLKNGPVGFPCQRIYSPNVPSQN